MRLTSVLRSVTYVRSKILLAATAALRRRARSCGECGFQPRAAGRPKRKPRVERREAQRARSRRFAQADRSVARAAPEARASGNIRPRGAAHDLAPPGAPFPCSLGEDVLSVA